MKKVLLVLLALGVIGIWSSAPAFALQLDFVPSSQTIGLGGTAIVDIVATLAGATAPEIVSAYDLDVAYDPSIVTAVALSFGNMLGGPSDSLQSAVGTSGLVDLAELSFLSDAALAALQGTGPITLATLYFSGDNLGTSPLTFANYGDGFNDIKGANNDPYLTPTLNSGSITVVTTGVPEPASLLMLLLGLLPLAGTTYRRKTGK